MNQVSDKVYFRDADPDGNDSLSKIARRIAPESTVLDLGCGPGSLGARLSARKRCVIDGVEGNPKAAALAVPNYRKVVVADLESDPLSAQLGGARYDYIVCADVLEHLRHPEALVAQLPALLNPSGRILLSIPNVAYAGVIGALVNGEFRYRSEGLLDETHVRFFTRKSLFEFVARCQLRVTNFDTVAMPINESEFRDDGVESLPPAVLRTLVSQRDALTYQFIVEVAPGVAGDAVAHLDDEAEAASFTYLAQLFYRGNHPFDAEHSCTLHGKMGVERQRLVFPLPSSASDVVALRLDPTNRPGYLRVYGMTLFSTDGECIWKWDPARPVELVRKNQLDVVRDDGGDGVLFVAEGDDPWLELPVRADELARLRGGGSLEVELAWPQSSDSLVVIQRMLGRDGKPGRLDELARLNSDMRAHIRTLSAEIKELQAQLREARTTIDAINRSLTFRLGRPLHAIVNRLRGSR